MNIPTIPNLVVMRDVLPSVHTGISPPCPVFVRFKCTTQIDMTLKYCCGRRLDDQSLQGVVLPRSESAQSSMENSRGVKYLQIVAAYLHPPFSCQECLCTELGNSGSVAAPVAKQIYTTNCTELLELNTTVHGAQ